MAEVLGFLGMLLVFTGGTLFFLRRAALVPAKDPRLPESLAFENV